MSITVDATYEDGVLKPAQPLPLSERERVRVTVEPHRAPERQSPEPSPQPGDMSLAARIVARARALPPSVIDCLPVDGAAQHDHYVYGTPKRPE